MNGYLIETRHENEEAWGGADILLWIGIASSAKAMIARIEGSRPSVVDRGPGVLARARLMGLMDGQVRRLRE